MRKNLITQHGPYLRFARHFADRIMHIHRVMYEVVKLKYLDLLRYASGGEVLVVAIEFDAGYNA